jgi:hypothetical protein
MSAGSVGVPKLPVAVLRDAVTRATARLSLRRAAGEMSISPNGLRNFLNGSAPHRATRMKLEHWLASERRVSRPPSVGQLVRLLKELSADLSPRQAAKLGREIVARLAEADEARRVSPRRRVRHPLRHFRHRRGKA